MLYDLQQRGEVSMGLRCVMVLLKLFIYSSLTITFYSLKLILRRQLQLKNILYKYECLSDHTINLQNSGVMFSTNVGNVFNKRKRWYRLQKSS